LSELTPISRFFLDVQRARIAMQQRLKKLKKERRDTARLRHMLSTLRSFEDEVRAEMEELAVEHPVWEAWLKHIKGIGPCMAGLLLGGPNPCNFPTVSKYWRIWGLAVIGGRAERFRRGKGKVHFDPRLKGIILGRIIPQLLMAKRGVWYRHYEAIKQRYLNRPDLKAAIEEDRRRGRRGALGHVELMSRRKVAKDFLALLWEVWRRIEGHPVMPERVRRATALRPEDMIDV